MALLPRTAVAVAGTLLLAAARSAAPQNNVTWFMYWFSPDKQERAWMASEGYQADGGVVLVFSRINNDTTRRLTYVRELYDCAGERVAVEIRREFDTATKTKVFEREFENPVSALKAINKGSRESFVYPGVCTQIGRRARTWTEAAAYFSEYSKEVEKLFARKQ
jgi:hypothetical protein